MARLMLLFLVASAATAAATDGAIEINQAVASAGIAPSDAPGFPVTLLAPGSYRLTGNLSVPGGVGISIENNNITLDLNGFSLLCTGGPACVLVGTPLPTGIDVPAAGTQNTTVRNGMVRGFRRGVWVANYSRVENVTATANTDIGLHVGIASVVRDSLATGDGYGIITGGGSLIEGNLIDDNAAYGLCTTSAVESGFRGNVLSQNGLSNLCPLNAPLGEFPPVNLGGNLCGPGPCL
jgi:hypothetical protein